MRLGLAVDPVEYNSECSQSSDGGLDRVVAVTIFLSTADSNDAEELFAEDGLGSELNRDW